MSRYLSSFIISIFVYVSLFASAVILFEKDDNFSDKKVQKLNAVSVCVITPEHITPKKTVKKKIVEKKKKINKKKIVKKPVIKKPIPVPKKIIPKPEIVKEEILKEEKVIVENTNEQKYAEIEKKQQVIVNKKSTKNHDEIKAKQNIFFTKLRNKINENKSYPRSARRRGIQGSVKVKFHLLSDGNVKNIEFLSGKKVFKSSILEAIENSFPIEVDNSLFSFPKEFKISIEYILS